VPASLLLAEAGQIHLALMRVKLANRSSAIDSGKFIGGGVDLRILQGGQAECSTVCFNHFSLIAFPGHSVILFLQFTFCSQQFFGRIISERRIARILIL